MFANRKLVIATMHSKELVIKPLLEREMKVSCFVPGKFNTDLLGTFSGEIERKGTPLETVREKCLKVLNETGCDLGVASEGSFGKHPTLFFTHANQEIVILIDLKNNLEIVGQALSTTTNFGGATVYSVVEGLKFAEKSGFPDHGLIIRNEENGFKEIHKDINDHNHLTEKLEQLIEKYQRAWMETDMRAMNNPTRMEVIKAATENLIQRIQSVCPNCAHPDFWVKNINPGLPCASCGLPTKSTLSHIYSCSACQYSTEKKFPKDKKTEDPTYCDYCNP